MFRILLSLLCLFAFACSTTKVAVVGDVKLIPFRTIGQRIPLVPVLLNGKHAWFIVDTGASITMLNATHRLHYEVHSYRTRDGLYELSGLSSVMNLRWKSFCFIEIGDLKFGHHVFLAEELDPLFAMIATNENIKIAGIIGSDLLAKYRMALDFRNRTLSYVTKP